MDDYLERLEKEHKTAMKLKQSDEYLIDTFPEAKELIPQKLEEYWQEATELYERLHWIRDRVDRLQVDTFSKWFYLKAEKFKEGRRLQEIQRQIQRLERQQLVTEKKEVEKHLSREYFKTIKERERFDIDKMFSRDELLIDIVRFSGVGIKQIGASIKALCPFHNEKTPSFVIYRNNWAHCFGCGWHGNFLNYIMKKNNCTFREALEEANRFL